MCRITDYHLQIFVEVWAEFDPDGTQFISVDKIDDFLIALIDAKCELFSAFNKDGIVHDHHLRQIYQNKLGLKLYCGYTKYNFYDIMISISQKFLIYIVSQPQERKIIIEDYENINKDLDKIDFIEEVIDKISDIQATGNVQFCKKLDKKLSQFRNSIINKIDRYEGNIYTSSTIPLITFIQRQYRKIKRKEVLEIMHKQKQE